MTDESVQPGACVLTNTGLPKSPIKCPCDPDQQPNLLENCVINLDPKACQEGRPGALLLLI